MRASDGTAHSGGRVAIGQAIEAQLGNRQRTRTDIEREPAEEESSHVATLPQVESGEKSRDVAARQAGFGGTTNYRKAKEVVTRGTPELVEAMDTGRASIHAADTPSA